MQVIKDSILQVHPPKHISFDVYCVHCTYICTLLFHIPRKTYLPPPYPSFWYIFYWYISLTAAAPFSVSFCAAVPGFLSPPFRDTKISVLDSKCNCSISKNRIHVTYIHTGIWVSETLFLVRRKRAPLTKKERSFRLPLRKLRKYFLILVIYIVYFDVQCALCMLKMMKHFLRHDRSKEMT